ncbi:MAG: hypothetical protein M3313_11105 [Actinomycetota bacterium]|nr:hypothetical protein [Actinomycetota bacterium]
MNADTEPLDTQVDRTALSWTRTAATLAVASLFFARWAERIGPVALLLALLGLSAAMLIGVRARSGARRRRDQFANGQARPPLWTALALCGISVLLAVVGLLAPLLG